MEPPEQKQHRRVVDGLWGGLVGAIFFGSLGYFGGKGGDGKRDGEHRVLTSVSGTALATSGQAVPLVSGEVVSVVTVASSSASSRSACEPKLMLPWIHDERANEAGYQAECGELSSMKMIEEKSAEERSVIESYSLAKGHVVFGYRDLSELYSMVVQRPNLAHDRMYLARLADLANEEPVALEAISLIAKLDGPESYDLLYSISQTKKNRVAGLFAKDLIRRSVVREKLTDPLLGMIELELLIESRPKVAEGFVKRCENVKTVIERIGANCDRRCISIYRELENQTGCGGAGREDCYPCLREHYDLKKLEKLANKASAPNPWVIPRSTSD